MGSHIDDLDASLAVDGEDIVLRRLINNAYATVTVRAKVRNFRLNSSDIVAGVKIIPQTVVISLTQIRAEGWPAGAPAAEAAPFDIDPAIPVEGDQVIIKGRPATVKSVDPIAVGDEGVVRVNMMVEG